MAQVDKQYLKVLADMSHLYFSNDELDALAVDIEGVLTYVERLSQSPYAAELEPPLEVGECSRMRDDVVVQADSAAVLAIAPEVERNFFVVPSIIKHEERA